MTEHFFIYLSLRKCVSQYWKLIINCILSRNIKNIKKSYLENIFEQSLITFRELCDFMIFFPFENLLNF